MTTMRHRAGRLILYVLLVGVVACGRAPTDHGPFDLVITGGRVMDPESGLDAPRDVGIRDGQIVAITEATLTAGEVLDATGLVVAARLYRPARPDRIWPAIAIRLETA